jgi:Golgi nucleoside diphosphatase
VPKIDLAVRDRQTKKIKPGLSSFAEKDDLLGAQQNIEQLLLFANEWVPADRRATTPALLKATAGLRAVKPAEKADAVLDRVRETLKKSEYLFKEEWADIIKGKEEAGLAWVAANYLQGSFEVPSAAAKALLPSSLGIIEMGGGSTQVCFESDAKEITSIQ